MIRSLVANIEEQRSTIGVVVKCVAVNTNSYNDAKRPAALIWDIRQYDVYSSTLPLSTAVDYEHAAVDLLAQLEARLSCEIQRTVCRRALATYAAPLNSITLIG